MFVLALASFHGFCLESLHKRIGLSGTFLKKATEPIPQLCNVPIICSHIQYDCLYMQFKWAKGSGIIWPFSTTGDQPQSRCMWLPECASMLSSSTIYTLFKGHHYAPVVWMQFFPDSPDLGYRLEHLNIALQTNKHDWTFMMLGKVHLLAENTDNIF